MHELTKPNSYVNYVRMAGGSVSLSRFIEDWAPIGATVAADLITEGLLVLSDGVLYTPPSEAELLKLNVTKHSGYSA